MGDFIVITNEERAERRAKRNEMYKLIEHYTDCIANCLECEIRASLNKLLKCDQASMEEKYEEDTRSLELIVAEVRKDKHISLRKACYRADVSIHRINNIFSKRKMNFTKLKQEYNLL